MAGCTVATSCVVLYRCVHVWESICVVSKPCRCFIVFQHCVVLFVCLCFMLLQCVLSAACNNSCCRGVLMAKNALCTSSYQKVHAKKERKKECMLILPNTKQKVHPHSSKLIASPNFV